MKHSVLTRLLSVLLAAMMLFAMPVQVLASESKTENPVLIEKGGDGKEPVVPGGGLIVNPGGGDGSGGKDPVIIIGGDPVLSVVAYLMTEANGRPGVASQTVYKKGAAYTDVYVSPSLTWIPGSKEALPDASEGRFDFLWVCVPEDASGLNEDNCPPVGVDRETWNAAVEAWWEEAEGTDRTREDLLAQLYGARQGWTDDVRLPVLGDDAAYACLARWTRNEDGSAIYAFSANAVQVSQAPPTVLEEPWPLEDFQSCNDSVGSSVPYFNATARYGDAEIRYQWYKAEGREYNGVPLEGETNAALQPPKALAPSEEAWYYCAYSFVNDDGEEETHFSTVAKVAYNPASQFDLFTVPGWFYMGSNPGSRDNYMSWNSRQYCDLPSSESIPGDSANVYYQSVERESEISPRLHPVSNLWYLPHSDRFTLQWYVNDSPALEGAQALGEAVILTDLNANKGSSYEFQRSLHDGTLVCPNEEAGEYYLIAVGRNYYTENGTEYVYEQTEYAKIVTFAQNEELYRANDAGEITNYRGHEREMRFPASVGGTAVTGISDQFRTGNFGPEKVVLPEGYKYIGEITFRDCVTLREAVLADSVEVIGAYAFRNSNLVSVNMPGSLRSIGDNAFENAPLTETACITLPTGVETVGGEAFRKTGLRELVLESFPAIDDYAFYGCTALTKVTFPTLVSGVLGGAGTFSKCTGLGQVVNHASIRDLDLADDFSETPFRTNYGQDVDPEVFFTFHDTQDSQGNSALIAEYYGDPAGSITVPGSFGGKPVVSIRPFSSAVLAALKTLTLPESLETIPDYAFAGSDLESVNFAELVNLKQIGRAAFRSCRYLSSPLVLREDTLVGMDAFESCYSLPSLQANGAWLAPGSFNYCFRLESFDKDFRPMNADGSADQIRQYENFTFAPCYESKNRSYTYWYSGGELMQGEPSEQVLRHSGHYWFSGEPDNAQILVYDDPFEDELSYPGSLVFGGTEYHIRSLDYEVFIHVQAETFAVTLQEGIEETGFGGGDYNGSPVHRIRAVTFPNSLRTLRESQFEDCDLLTSVTFYENLEAIPNRAFLDCDALVTVDLTGAAALTAIGDQAFYACDALESVLLPEQSGLQTVGVRAFWNDGQLTAFDLSRAAALTGIGAQAFLGTGLTTLDLSACAGLETIPEYAFYGTLHLERVLLPEGLRSIGRAAFSRDALGSSVTSNLARYAPISELELPSTLETVGAGAFWKCFLGEEGSEPIVVSLPDSLKTIENGAFASSPPLLDPQAQKNYVNLLALASPRLPASLLTLGGYTGSGTVPGLQSGVFANSLVEELDLPAGLEQVGDYALYDLPPCTVTFRSKGESSPVISNTALINSQMTLRCYLGSAAYAWAMAYNETHERGVEIRLLEEGGMLSVQPLFRDGQPVPPDSIESIVWKDEDGQTVGSGLSIYDCALGRPYTAVFALTNDYDWDYRLDRSEVTLEASEAAVAAEVYLIPRERITVRGRVACAYSAEAVTATLTLTSAQGAVRTLRQNLDPADPVFSFEDVPMCGMDLLADAVGHRSVGLVSVQLASDAQGVADLGEIELTEPAPRYFYTMVCRVNGEERAMDGEAFRFAVLNTATGEVLSPETLDGSRIAFVPDSVQEGDVIRVSAQPKEDGEWAFLKPAEGELRVCGANEPAPFLALDFIEQERIEYTVYDYFRKGGHVGVYAAGGTLAAEITIPRNTAKTRDVLYISPGDYTLLAMQDNTQLGLLEKLEDYEALGITSGIWRQTVSVPPSGAANAVIDVPKWETLNWFHNLNATLSAEEWIDRSGKLLIQLALDFPDESIGIEKEITVHTTENMYYDSGAGVAVNDPAVDFSADFSRDLVIRTSANQAVFSFFALNDSPSEDPEMLNVSISLLGSSPIPLVSRRVRPAQRRFSVVSGPTTRQSGGILAELSEFLNASRLEVYLDGELNAWSRIRGGVGQVPYLFPEKSGYHTVEVLARRADGEIVARQEPYRVYYVHTVGERAEQPIGKRLDVVLENGAAAEFEGYHDVSVTYDLRDASANRKKLYFATWAGKYVNGDGTFNRPVSYRFSLSFVNPEAADPEDVWIYLYRTDGTYLDRLQLIRSEETGAYEGEITFAPGTITVEDRIGYVSYTAGTAEKDQFTPVMAPVELPDWQAGYEEDLAYVREQMENFAPVTDEALNWLFDEYYAQAGEELPPEVKADIRNYVYTVNNLLGEFYELFSRVYAQMTEEPDLGSLTDKLGPIRTEPFGAEVTPAQLEAQGYTKALVEGSDACICVYYGEGWTEIYDFSTMTHGVIDLRELPGEEAGSLMAFTGTEFEEESTVTSVLKKTLDFISKWEPYVASAANTMSNVGDEVEDAFDAEFDALITDLEKKAGQLKTAQQELDAAKKEWQNRRYIESVLESCFKNVPSDYSFLQRSVSDVYAESLAAMQDRDTAHVYDMLRRYQETEKEYNGLKEKYAAALKDGKSRTVRVHAQLEKLAQKHPQLANAERGLLTKLSALNKWFSSASPAKAGRFVKALSFAGKRVSKGLAIVDMLVNINSIVGNLSVYNPEVTNYDMEVEYVDELFVKFQRRLERYDASEEWKEEKLDHVEDCAIELLTLMKRRMNTVTQMLGSELVGTISAMIGDIVAFADVPKQVTLATDSVSILGSVGAFALSFRLSDLDEEIQTWWRLYEESMLLEGEEEEDDDDDDDGGIPDLNPGGTRIPLNSPIIHDPAGVVYEAVLSNVLEGATASVYYKDGDSEVLWDAENYNQDNPQSTDEYGEYMWMTPEGRWKVRVQLEGYLDGSSENDPRAEEGWLPVLPPQLNVNIPLVSKALPTVLDAAAEGDGVTVTFSQYMETAQFEEGALVTLTVDGAETPAALSFADAEQSPTQEGVYYGRTLLVAPADGSSLAGKTVTVTIAAAAVNYAGNAMAADYAGESLYVEPAEPEEPTQPENPTQPEEPTQPENPTQPEEPDDPQPQPEPGNAAGSETVPPQVPDKPESPAPTEPQRPFADVAEGNWFYEAVYYCYDKGYFKGTSAGEFAPGETMTRAMFATVLYRIAGEPEVAEGSSFADVEKGKWYSDAIAWAAGEGIIDGYGNGLFGRDDPVTREQMAVLFWRYAGKPEAESGDLSAYSDADRISAWARDAVSWAVIAGVMNGNGDGTLDPRGDATRAEVAQIVMNFDTKVR